jgi:hypothetical protein
MLQIGKEIGGFPLRKVVSAGVSVAAGLCLVSGCMCKQPVTGGDPKQKALLNSLPRVWNENLLPRRYSLSEIQ